MANLSVYPFVGINRSYWHRQCKINYEIVYKNNVVQKDLYELNQNDVWMGESAHLRRITREFFIDTLGWNVRDFNRSVKAGNIQAHAHVYRNEWDHELGCASLDLHFERIIDVTNFLAIRVISNCPSVQYGSVWRYRGLRASSLVGSRIRDDVRGDFDIEHYWDHKGNARHKSWKEYRKTQYKTVDMNTHINV